MNSLLQIDNYFSLRGDICQPRTTTLWSYTDYRMSEMISKVEGAFKFKQIYIHILLHGTNYLVFFLPCPISIIIIIIKYTW